MHYTRVELVTRIYSRVYHEIVDDPKFARVYDNDAALATWLRMLLLADATHPMPAPLPRRTSAVSLLIDVGLVEERPGHRFVIKGLQVERERRSASGRIGAAVRWENERNANAMPSKAEQRKDEQGANAPKSFMSFPPKPKPGSHEGQHNDCLVCDGVRPKPRAVS